MLTSAGTILFSIMGVFANAVITNEPRPSCMDFNPAGPLKTAAHTPLNRLCNSPGAGGLACVGGEFLEA
jgi:hypothetical protein